MDVIGSATMGCKLGEADPVLRALFCNLIIRLADAAKMDEELLPLLNAYYSLVQEEIDGT
tara:strand:- start:368 stop:547 length:180 start_codon:yes stop_codon:yes gene_type:complete